MKRELDGLKKLQEKGIEGSAVEVSDDVLHHVMVALVAEARWLQSRR